MKISGKFILKVAGTLTVIALVVAALLGVVNNVTKDKIAEQDAENTRIAMSAVAPEGSEFGDKMDISDAVAAAASAQGGKIVEMYPMTNGGADAGYVVKVSASGSQGTITMMVGVDANKAITGISVISHSETSGIGTKVVGNEPNAAGEPVLDQFIGRHERLGLSRGRQECHRRLRRHRFHQGHHHGRQCRSGRRGSAGLRKEELHYEFW